MTVMLAGNENLDVMVSLNYAALVSKGQLLPMNELADKYGEGIKEALGFNFDTPQINGQVYGVTPVKDWAQSMGVCMRQDLVDKYLLDFTNVRTLEALQPLMKKIKDGEPNMIPYGGWGGGITGMYFSDKYDDLGGLLGSLKYNSTDNKVVDLYETQDYADALKTAREWYQQGLLAKDAATNKESPVVATKAGKMAGFLSAMKPGIEKQWENQTGYPMYCNQTFTDVVTTTSIASGLKWSIPRNSKDPERAMMFLNLLFTDKDLVNLMDWGIEGKHYVKKSDNIIDFPDGVNGTNSGYALNQGFLFGNQFLSYVWEGDSPDLYEQLDQFNKAAVRSSAFGFMFDVEPVKTEWAAVTNVVTQYGPPLETGSVDPATTLPKFIDALRAAGSEKIIAEKQKQFDAWLKTKS